MQPERACQPVNGAARPLLVFVSGAPGTGKSTLASHLARALGWPLLNWDTFQEELWDAWVDPPRTAGPGF